MSIANLGSGAADLDALAAAARDPRGGVQPPAGLPDVATLTKLANAFYAALPGQSLPVSAGPSLPGFGASPVEVAGSSAPHAAASATSPLPTPGISGTLATPTIGSPLDSSAIDDRVFDSLAGAAIPSPPSSTLSGPSLPGFGASPTEAAGQAVAQSAPTTNVASIPGIDAPATAVPASTRDVSVIDLNGVDTLTRTPDPLLPSSVDAGPSLSGFGGSRDIPARPEASRSADALPGISQSSPPQPPPATPPPQVLSNHTGIETPHSGGSIRQYDRIALPFEAELRSLLAPLAAEPYAHGRGADVGSGFYFLDRQEPSARGISVPGAEAPARLPASGGIGFDVDGVRRDFPILNERVNGRPLIWFDNAATTQKPKSVIERLKYFYEHENSNIHRAAHELAARATDAYEGARSKIARFLNAGSAEEIIFTRGATEAINLVAATFGQQHIGAGDEIVVTNLEHHANIVPWQQLCLAKGAKLRVAPVDDCGALLLDEFGKLLNSRTKLVAFTQVSNALGTITPAKTIVEMAHRVGARVLVDGAQSVSHMKVDVQDLDADFFVFSGHKIFAPTGIGVLYGKKALMDSLPPYQTGGNMIRDVTFERVEFHKSPQRFEAGTGNIADAVGLGAAIDYVERIGLQNIADYEHKLLVYATERLLQIPGLRIIGTAPEKASVISLTLKGIPSEEIGSRLNKYGIAVRSGHHCAQPILRRFGQETTVRPSFAFYNTCGEIDVLVGALKDIQAETGLTRL
ncbi:family 2A encapsulin nanocompartment cargo protein cysteine desulfurase [Hyphomicrobium facile]|uniref:cysteine desulfurase n=1 Tax=Hyphomicrobium facile TaxID=51670 RepID=A0A1I7N543_9HYPH|nr:family 2A encapsulin nanocompartment cargo protein cysteine desulfurase [Hyphomicrobium facile]SFV29789.1 cysteine desulfurase /L-selenocysteine selenide-lyase (L-alanine-forming) [Hyphomicrobium facile]